jgi:hypothetical protein
MVPQAAITARATGLMRMGNDMVRLLWGCGWLGEIAWLAGWLNGFAAVLFRV